MEEAARVRAQQGVRRPRSRSAAAAPSTRARRRTSSTCYPAPLLDYINKPVGRGVPVPGPLRPLIAVPTTAGTGSETTAVAVTHIVDQNVKAGVSHPAPAPALGVVDPLNTLTRAARGDRGGGRRHPHPRHRVLHHAPYNARAKHHPPDRPAYIGANPASDIWCEKAMEYAAATCAARCSTASTSRRACTWRWPPTTRASASATRGCTSPRGRLSDRRASCATTCPSGYPHPPPAGPARHVGDPHRARRLPLHLRDRAGAAPPRRRAARRAGGRPHRGRAARGAAPGAASRSCATSASPTGSPRSATPSATPARSIEGTLQQPRLLVGAPRHVGAADLDVDPARRSMQYW